MKQLEPVGFRRPVVPCAPARSPACGQRGRGLFARAWGLGAARLGRGGVRRGGACAGSSAARLERWSSPARHLHPSKSQRRSLGGEGTCCARARRTRACRSSRMRRARCRASHDLALSQWAAQSQSWLLFLHQDGPGRRLSRGGVAGSVDSGRRAGSTGSDIWNMDAPGGDFDCVHR